MKKFLVILILISFCGGNYDIQVVENSTTTTLLIPEITIDDFTWDDLYPVCTSENFLNYEVVSTILLLNNLPEMADSTVFFEFSASEHNKKLQQDIKNFCKESFMYQPMDSTLWNISAFWLEEIVYLNSWMKMMNTMCNNYPPECEGWADSENYFEFQKYTLGPAFKISSYEDEYLCYLESTSITNPEPYFENNRFVRFSNDISLIGSSNEERKPNIIGNQYFRSSVIFPKPITDPDGSTEDFTDETYYSLNPTSLYTFYNDIRSEPLHLWNCLFNSNSENLEPVNANWIIYGFGPPVVKGNIDISNPEIDAKYVMWSILEPGIEAKVKEYEISEIYWFSELPTLLEFCKEYKLDEEFMSKFDITYPWETEKINKNYVTSYFCFNQLNYRS